MSYNEEGSLNALKDLLKTVGRLRAPDGCPWDKEQTTLSLRPYLVEETYETIEVMDQVTSPDQLKKPAIRNAFVEEWGDVLLQILLNAEVASEADATITFEAIAKTLNEKLIRRHPHVFGDVTVSGTDDVLKNWEEIKKTEKAAKADSVFSSISSGMPPLPRTMKIIQKVSKVGFQWPDLAGPIEKLSEEVQELKAELTRSDRTPEQHLQKVEGEMGDVLFSVCNIASFMKIDPEAALRSTLRKFESRFRFVETALKARGKSPSESNLAEMDSLWNDAKKVERGL
jgi:tetrapyrrole methylase family protein/MazG family protein